MFNEREYVDKVIPYLEKSKKIGEKVNFRCPICGDGKTSYKTRCWILKGDTYYIHCFNCGTTISFKEFLKEYHNSLYNEYVFDKIKNKNNSNEYFQYKEKEKIDRRISLFVESLLVPCSEDKEAITYIKNRNINPEKYNDLFVIEDFSELTKLEKYESSNLKKEKRLILPCYNNEGIINGIIARDISGKSNKRYINLKFYDGYNFFGLYDKEGSYKINLNKTVYVVEGAIDSLFLNNAVSVNNADLLSFENGVGNIIKFLDVIYIGDNDNRNKEIYNFNKKIIKNNKKIVIWPSYIEEKDINDIINAGYNINNVINDNIYSGMKAELILNKWKKF